MEDRVQVRRYELRRLRQNLNDGLSRRPGQGNSGPVPMGFLPVPILANNAQTTNDDFRHHTLTIWFGTKSTGAMRLLPSDLAMVVGRGNSQGFGARPTGIPAVDRSGP